MCETLRGKRAFGLLVMVAAALLLASCTKAAPTATVAPTATAAATATPTQAVTPTPAPTKEPEVKEATVTVLLASWGNNVFDPVRAQDASLSWQRLLQAFLVQGGTGGAQLPGVAKAWELSKDGKTWTFTVRDGVKAHNGEEINVDDVLGNLSVRFGKNCQARTGYTQTPDMDKCRQFVRLEKQGDKVLWELQRAWLDMPYHTSETSGAPGGGAIVPQDYWDKVGEDGYEKNPVGAGPFKLVSFKPDQEMVFERFDDYYYQPKYGFPEDRRPKFRRLVMRLVPEPATRAAAIQAGQADLIAANLLMVKDIERAGGKVAYQQEASYSWVLFIDCWDPALWCYKKEVRQALEYAVDKDSIVKNLYGPEVAVVTGWVNVTPSSLGYTPGVTDPFPYDVQKAKDLLTAAGFPDGKGIPSIKIYTWVAADIPMLPEVAQAVADMWKKVGVQSEVVVGDGTTIRSMQRDRKIPGSVMIRENNARWSGIGNLVDYYTNPENKGRVCDRTMSPECAALAKLIEEKYLNAPVKPLAQFEPEIKEILRAVRDANHMTMFFYTNTPWGLGPRVKDYRPWSLVPNLNAIWTLELK